MQNVCFYARFEIIISKSKRRSIWTRLLGRMTGNIILHDRKT